ncbi:MAG: proton-conducting transporter membrane subunit, partial [Vicinamibacteria bacterium]
MTWSRPALLILAWIPAMGAVAAAMLPERRAALRRFLALGFALLPLAAALAHPSRELRAWVPALGLDYDLAIATPFASIAVVWIPVLAGIALLSMESSELGRRTASLVLLAETSLLGLLTSGDAALWLGFYGGGLLTGTLLLERAGAMKKFFFFQAAALALMSGIAWISYHLNWVQTGFPSAEIARFASLVGYPDFEGRMFLLGAAALALACPLVPFTAWLAESAEALPTPGRLLLLGGWSLAGTDFFSRGILPSFSRGAEGSANAMAFLAALGTLYAGLAPYRGARERRWIPLLVGFQGLVVLGLLSPSPEGVAAGRSGMLHLALALTALALWSSEGRSSVSERPTLWTRALRFALLSMVFLPTWWVVLREEWSRSSTIAAIAGMGLALMVVRLVRTLPPLTT